MARHRLLARRHRRRRCHDGDAGPAARHRLLRRHAGHRAVRAAGHRGPGSRRHLQRDPGRRRSSSSTATRPTARFSSACRRASRSSRARASSRAPCRFARRCRRRACRSSRSSARRSSGPVDRRRSAAPRRLRHAGVDPRDHRLHRLPFPLLVRRRRDRGDAARHLRDAGVPDVLRLRPVAQRRRGAADDHRLLRQRHHRHLRPRAREPPYRCGAIRWSRS